MKKLISMMLMLCAVFAFSACSSDDDTNPITNAVVPSSAKIGSEVTVQGNGFSTTQNLVIWLSQDDVTEQLSAKMSSSGATFTIPYTFKEGAATVIVDDGKKWELGSILLVAADNPISAIAVSSETPIATDQTISGIGFTDDDAIVAVLSSDETVSVDCNAAVTSNGIKFDASKITSEGDYDICLRRGQSEWVLGQSYFYQPKRIETISIADNYMITMYASLLGLKEDVLTLTLGYNTDGTLNSVKSNCNIGWELTYKDNTVSSTDGQNVFTLDNQKRVVSSVGKDMYGDATTYTWAYDADGYLKSVKPSSTAASDFTLTYTENNLSAYDLGGANSFTTDKSIRCCPGTADPTFLANAFFWAFSREDLFLGFLLNQNVKISSYVPTQMSAYDMDFSTGADKTVTAKIETSFSNNALTLKTTGTVISQAQGLYSNTVVVTYKNK